MGNHGKASRVSQKDLAKIIGVSASEIRAIENGQRRLTAGVLNKVCFNTCAFWEEDKKEWVFPGGLPFTFACWQAFRSGAGKPIDDDLKEKDVKILDRKITRLLEAIPDRHRFKLLVRLHDFLMECQADFRLRKVEKFFMETCPICEIGADPGAGKIRVTYGYQPPWGRPGADVSKM
jgi:transcriptional regulator with XRE-family HTH domain